MGDALKKERINVHRLTDIISEQLRNQPNQTGQLNLRLLAEQFHVSPPAILYQLDQLVKNGILQSIPISEKRKHYRLIEAKKPEFDLYRFSLSIDDLEKDLKKNQKPIFSKTIKTDHLTVSNEEILPVESKNPIAFHETIDDFPMDSFELTEELTSNHIDDFVQRIQAAPTADVMLQKSDAEILAVMVESINQQSIFLRDLADQLSYAKDKKMVQFFIEERNRLLLENEQLKQAYQEEVEKQRQAKKIDGQKIRLYQQNVMHMINSYTSSTPQELVLRKHEFNQKLTETIQDLIKYVLIHS